jgi:hypothetical protein
MPYCNSTSCPVGEFQSGNACAGCSQLCDGCDPTIGICIGCLNVLFLPSSGIFN